MNTSYKPVAQRLLKGLGAQGLSQVTNLFIRFFEVPLFLTFWGPERYGEWLMVAAIPSYLAMADGGFTSTTQREMTMKMGHGDRNGALNAFQSTWLMLLLLSIILLIISFFAFTSLPICEWLNLKTMNDETFAYVAFFLVMHILLGFQCGLIYGGYSCEGRYARGTNLQSIGYLLEFGGLALTVMLGGGPVAAAGGFLAGRMISVLIFFIDLPRVAPWLHFGWHHATASFMQKILRPSLASMAFPLGTAFNHHGMRLLVGIILGPIAVAVFSSMRTLCRSALQPLSIIVRLIEPELALAYGAGNHALVRTLFMRASQIAVWLVLFACLLLWFAGEPLLRFWGRGVIEFDITLFSWLLIASAANSLWYVALMVPYATNRHGYVALFFIGVNSCMLLLAPILMKWLGISGSGVIVLMAELMMIAYVLPVAFSLTQSQYKKWILSIIKPRIKF